MAEDQKQWDEVRIACMEAQIRELRRQNKLWSDWHDTTHTPFWKRMWFVIQGYNLFSLGTWYNASWNKDGQRYN